MNSIQGQESRTSQIVTWSEEQLRFKNLINVNNQWILHASGRRGENNHYMTSTHLYLINHYPLPFEPPFHSTKTLLHEVVGPSGRKEIQASGFVGCTETCVTEAFHHSCIRFTPQILEVDGYPDRHVQLPYHWLPCRQLLPELPFIHGRQPHRFLRS